MKLDLTKRDFIFQPWIVLLASFGGAVAYALYALRSPTTRSQVADFSGPFFYVAPIVVPFVAFLFDRAERFRKLNVFHVAVDAVVVGLAIGRVVGNVPLISGHTLFLTYAILSSRSVIVKVTALLLMVQTVYLKYFVWHDFVTSTSGILLGTVAALLVYIWGARSS
jgi:hypothetical protein